MSVVQATGSENIWWVLGLVVLTVGTYYLAKWQAGRGPTRKILHQVQNDHKTNLRDDVDQVLGKLDRVIAVQDKHGEDIRHVKTQIHALSLDWADMGDTQERDKMDLQAAVRERNREIARLRNEIPEIVEQHCKKKGCNK